MEEEQKKSLVVSDEFIEVYKYLNAVDMHERIEGLSQEEKYLLVMLSLDNHDIAKDMVRENLLPYKSIGQDIYDCMEGNENDSEIIASLIERTGDKYIDVSVLVDKYGNEMPGIADTAEIRAYKMRIFD